MGKDIIYVDKNGNKIEQGSKLFDGYDTCTAEIHWGEWYIVGQRDMWLFTQFAIDVQPDGTGRLIDFEIVEE